MKSVVISYPCCGRTWLYKILKTVESISVQPNKDVLIDKQHDVYFTHDMFDYVQDTVHYSQVKEYFQDPYFMGLRGHTYDGRRLGWLIRDPRDVLVSYYYQKKHREPWLQEHSIIEESRLQPIEMTIDEFVFDDRYGIKTLVEFYNGVLEHYQISAVLSYEEIHRYGPGAIKLFIKRLGLQAEDSEIEYAFGENVFQKVQAREVANRFLRTGEMPPTKTMKARRGCVGGYDGELSEETVDKLNKYISENLNAKYGPYI